MKFKAAVLHKSGQELVVEDIEAGPLKSGDVLIRLCASGLCHTDLEVIQGSIRYPMPIVLGHEGAGVVEAVGEGVTLVKPGDHVVCSWNPYCGHCFYCDQDKPILCEQFGATEPKGHLLDGTSRLTVGGEKLHHYSVVSSHAQYCIVPQTGAIPVPKEISFDRACLIGCGVMTGVGAVTKVAQVSVGDSVVVIGCGTVGLNVLQGARLVGAELIIGVDVRPEKLKKALQFGATHTVNAAEEDAVEAVRALTQGRGADNSIEAGGNEKSFQLALEVARPGAKVVILGKTDFESFVSFRFGSLLGEKQITRSSYGGARPRQDFPLLARLYLDGKLMLDELIERRLDLSEINDGFTEMRAGSLLRAVVLLDG